MEHKTLFKVISLQKEKLKQMQLNIKRARIRACAEENVQSAACGWPCCSMKSNKCPVTKGANKEQAECDGASERKK